ncbi:MAG: GNAT family N-acetyltransferase [Actinomyces sp.]|uniref:GNAT family N-acetyltransferase n=1 Tax=Actinomyces sp. TaxID=29317 RepID=UPI0026DC5F72|nr:GNAT family N-acetyltransferase [Actinomyces sp.]MDO4243907.1 GNAT family N-acetyltransferase [Actinomyces sp.]
MTQTPIAEPLRPGFPVLRIPPALQLHEPVSFTAIRGDEAGARAEAVRLGIMDVRLEVFVAEQAVPFAQEIDARDFEPGTIHVLARGADSIPLAAGRLLTEPGHPGRVHLGRLAVRMVARGTGLGARMVAALEKAAIEHAGTPVDAHPAAGLGPGARTVTVILSAQEQAMGFYRRCGYRVLTGESYLDAGIPHQDMARTLTRGSAPGAGAR